MQLRAGWGPWLNTISKNSFKNGASLLLFFFYFVLAPLSIVEKELLRGTVAAITCNYE